MWSESADRVRKPDDSTSWLVYKLGSMIEAQRTSSPLPAGAVAYPPRFRGEKGALFFRDKERRAYA